MTNCEHVYCPHDAIGTFDCSVYMSQWPPITRELCEKHKPDGRSPLPE